MNFKIIPLYSGKKAKIYTIRIEDAELSEYEQFVFDNRIARPTIVKTLDLTLKNMVRKSGFIDEFFLRESPLEFNVFKITETDDVRLYCIRYSGVAIIVGGGGIKIPKTIKLNENPHLQKKVDFLVEIESKIQERIDSKKIRITDDGIEGDLFFKE